MNSPNFNLPVRTLKYLPILILLAYTVSCSDSSNDDMQTESEIAEEEGSGESETPTASSSECSDAGNFVFNEKDGLVNVEFEDAEFSEDWELKSSDVDHTGKGYMVWTGNQSLGQTRKWADNF